MSPCPCPREQTPPGPAAPRAGRSAAGAAGEAAAAALEPPDRSLSRLHLNVSETLFVPLTYNRQQPINWGQGSFLPAGCSGGQRPVRCPRCPGWHPELGAARRDPRPHRAPRRSPSAPLVSAVSAGLFENCTGCVLCSEDNGCITCHHRLFLLIWRDGIRQYGMCVHTCPPGYFGVRGLEVNRCTSTWCVRRGPCASERPGVPSLPRGSSPNPELRLGRAPGPFAHRELAPSSQPPFPAECRSPSCESCFSKDFCMKCKEKFYLHKGQCFRQCPPGTAAQPGTRECQGKRRPLPAPHGSCQRGVATIPLPVPLFSPQRRASRGPGASGAPAPTRAGPAAASGAWRRGCARSWAPRERRGLRAPRCWRPESAA